MSSPSPLVIRRAEDADFDGIWRIFHEVVARGDTYSYDPATTKEEARDLWMPTQGRTYVAVLEGEIVGTYLMKPNQPGLGSHVVNCGYIVRADQAGRGIGRALCQHSLEAAREAGFLAMQFNFVVSTNTRAVALWERMGFAIVGTVQSWESVGTFFGTVADTLAGGGKDLRSRDGRT